MSEFFPAYSGEVLTISNATDALINSERCQDCGYWHVRRVADSRGVQPGYASPSTTAKHPGSRDGGAREISLLRRRPTGDLKIAPFCTLLDSPRSMQQLS